MTKIELSLDVSDKLAREAREAGLLAPDALAEMLALGVRQKAAERIAAARRKPGGTAAMHAVELQEIVDSIRKRSA